MATDENIKYQGTLEKQCRLKTWAWKKYWFVLFNEQLCYYKEQDGTKSGGGRRLSSNEMGEIDLNNAHTVKEMKNVNHGFPFEILTKSRSYILSADKEESRAQWVKYLQQAVQISMAKRRTSSIRSIHTSCNSIDEVEDGYAQIQSMSRHSGGAHTLPCKLPNSNSRPQSTITGSIREETDDDLYSDITIEGKDSAFDEPEDQGNNDPDYDYAPVDMRRKSWKFMKQKNIESDIAEDEGIYDDTYAEVNFETANDKHSNALNAGPSKDKDNEAEVKSASKQKSVFPEYSSVIPRSKRGENAGNSKTGLRDESAMPEYSKVTPKAQRNITKTTSLIGDANPNKAQDGDYVSLRDVNCNSNKHHTVYATRSLMSFSDIPTLPFPRMEYTDRSHFDDIRLFLSRNRGINEIFRDPPQADLGGKAIDVLNDFLAGLDAPSSGTSRNDVESTHL